MENSEVGRRYIQYALDNSKCLKRFLRQFKEILLLCLLHVNLLQEKPTIQETFLDSVHVQGGRTSAAIGNHILNILLRHKIDLEHCRVQVHDGASAMASKSKGASVVIKRQEARAEFVQCRSHCINLAVLFACKNQVIRAFMVDLTSVRLFFANSPKRQQYFEKFIHFHKELFKVSETNRTHIIGLSK